MKYKILSLLLSASATLHAQDTLRLSLLFTGDIMQHETQINSAYDPSISRYNYFPVFQYIKPVLSSADLTIGNLEFTLGGKPYKGYPQFSAPDEILEAIKDAGFDVLVTANNHSVDRFRKGLERTIDLLDSNKIPHTGTFKDTTDWLNDYPMLIESKGFRLSLLNYTYGTNGIRVSKPNIVNLIDTAQIHRDLMKARLQQPDAIIVFMHWGLEYQSLPAPDQKQLAEFCFRHGAKLVIGSHPHVLQPMEWRKEQDQFVVYSLGNFVSAQWERYRNGGAMAHIRLEKIMLPDGKAAVRIADARYSLEWVYREPSLGRRYFVVPVGAYENDPTIPAPGYPKQLFQQFIQDSRSHYGKYNLNVPEWKSDKP
jgi:poly-gamma-glutamate synthesis protein (capsule biosynthesis protein)